MCASHAVAWWGSGGDVMHGVDGFDMFDGFYGFDGVGALDGVDALGVPEGDCVSPFSK